MSRSHQYWHHVENMVSMTVLPDARYWGHDLSAETGPGRGIGRIGNIQTQAFEIGTTCQAEVFSHWIVLIGIIKGWLQSLTKVHPVSEVCKIYLRADITFVYHTSQDYIRPFVLGLSLFNQQSCENATQPVEERPFACTCLATVKIQLIHFHISS